MRLTSHCSPLRTLPPPFWLELEAEDDENEGDNEEHSGAWPEEGLGVRDLVASINRLR